MALHLCSNLEESALPKQNEIQRMIDFLKAAIPSRRHPCLKHKRWTPFEACGRCHTVSHAFIYLEMLKRKKRKSFHLAGITGIEAQRRGETLKTEGCVCCLILDFKAAIFPVLGWCLCIYFFLAGSVFLLHSSLFYHRAPSLPQSGPSGSCNTWVFLGSLVEVPLPGPSDL